MALVIVHACASTESTRPRNPSIGVRCGVHISEDRELSALVNVTKSLGSERRVGCGDGVAAIAGSFLRCPPDFGKGLPNY